MLSPFSRLLVSSAVLATVAARSTGGPDVAPIRHFSPDSLEVADGLAATLVAEAPTITNPTNIDVDARGRGTFPDRRSAAGFSSRERHAAAPDRAKYFLPESRRPKTAEWRRSTRVTMRIAPGSP